MRSEEGRRSLSLEPAQTAWIRRCKVPGAVLPGMIFGFLLVFFWTTAARGSVRFWTTAARGNVSASGPETAFAAAASGPGAASWNPANLALFPETRIEVFSLRAGLGNNSYSIGDYNELNGAFWDEAQKQEILSQIETSRVTLEASGRLGAAGVSFEGLAFSTETRVASVVAVPKEVLEILLNGNTVGETFSLDGAEGAGIAFTEARISMARPLSNLLPRVPAVVSGWTVGASVKLLEGWFFGELLEASGGITTTDELIYGEGKLCSMMAQGGRGFGFDLGFAGPLGCDWTGSVAVRDLLASITWTADAEERIDVFEVPGISLGSDGCDEVNTESATRPLDSVETNLPVIFSVGAAHHGDGVLTAIHFEVATDSRYGASSNPLVSMGAAWQLLSWLVVRGAADLGGAVGTGLGGSVGVAIGPIQLDMGLQSRGTYNVFNSKGVTLATALSASL
ncbi:MAG: hypothetical protein KAY24_04430 [Candidatus Eisenbacteria sp.]|nr:hypothetical protein [Candidatus Eisenbacteria bacterium]